MQDSAPATSRYTVMDPARHSLYQCRNVEQFCRDFEATTGRSVREITDHVLTPAIPRAVFLVGSIPLQMATPGSDIDVMVLVDQKDALLGRGRDVATNTEQHLAFFNDSDLLKAGEFLTVVGGVMVDVTAIVTPSLKRVYARLRSKGPELGESEILTLGRLRTGWLLWQSEDYLERNALTLADPALDIYCATKHFVSALAFVRKGSRALDLLDLPLALHLGRSSVEAAYLAYFASEGLAYLGARWPAQLGCARGAAERVQRHPLLQRNLGLLFPSIGSTPQQTAQYLQAVSEFLTAMRELIEQKILFRIAFKVCPQIDAG